MSGPPGGEEAELRRRAAETVERAREAAGLPPPRLAIVLGSGLGGLAERVEEATELGYGEIPGWPRSTVSGHAGQLVLGRLGGVPVVCMAGRVHLYEGPEPRRLAFPLRVFARLGVEVLFVSNAAGAVNRTFEPGELMLITDHLNLLWANPLVGPSPEGEPRWPDLHDVYDPALCRELREAARREEVRLREGTYAAMLGPSYETPAEIRMLGRLGADAVGMSTVPEVLAARAAGIRCAGVSCLTNRAAGLGREPLDHREVLETTERVADGFQRLVVRAVGRFEERNLV